MAIPYTPTTHSDGQSWTAAKANLLENAVRDAHYMPFVQVSHNTTNSVLNNTATALACNTESFDRAANAADTMHDTATNNSRLTCRYAGAYLCWAAGITWSANPTNCILQFRDTGGTLFGIHQWVSDFRTMAGMGIRDLSVNDYVECLVTQVSGGTLTVAASFEFGMTRIA